MYCHRTFNELKKESKKINDSKNRVKLAVLGDFATQHLVTALNGWGNFEDIKLNIFETEYDQIEIQTLSGSELYGFEPDVVLLAMCAEKMRYKFCQLSLDKRGNFAELMFSDIKEYWERISEHTKASVIMTNFVEKDDRVFGDFGLKTDSSFVFQVKKLNMMIMERALDFKNVFIVDINRLALVNGMSYFCSDKMYYIARIPFSMEGIADIAGSVIDIIKAINGRIKKCIVLDLDGTLWGGTIGEDGLNGIELGELGSGRAFSDFQYWLKELKERGIILAVCSKNDEDNAKLPFEKHPDMVLKLDDISVFIANWNDKASNIKYIKEILNIGMDSIAFLDDNSFERNLVREMLPEITVPELPEDPAQYMTFLQDLNLFETASYSSEDEKRTLQYKAEFERKEMSKKYESYDDYLSDLDMKAEVQPFSDFYYPRISQLTQRSNQFNLRTIRYTEGDIKRIAEDDEHYITLHFILSDKFGDHGLISVVIMKKVDEKTLFIDTWLMSCRVLNRTTEAFIINSIVEIAYKNGYEKVIGEYIKTPKNGMVKDIYETLGFKRIDDCRFEVETKNFKKNKTFVEVK